MSRCFRNISTDSASINTCSCTLSSLMSVLCVRFLCNEFRYFLSFLNRSVFPLEQEVISRGVAINSGTVNCNCKDITLNGPVFSWVSHGLGGAHISPPDSISALRHLSKPWVIGAKHDYCWLSSKDLFEIYNFPVAQNLTILETNMRFCWKCQKIRTIF